MVDPFLEYCTWRRGAEWHWQVLEVTTDYLQFIASGVAIAGTRRGLKRYKIVFATSTDNGNLKREALANHATLFFPSPCFRSQGHRGPGVLQ
jgi:hypothetical protein